jgi:hypothetical protein
MKLSSFVARILHLVTSSSTTPCRLRKLLNPTLVIKVCMIFSCCDDDDHGCDGCGSMIGSTAPKDVADKVCKSIAKNRIIDSVSVAVSASIPD